ncbi:LysR family transcriptional regulator [Vibrio sp. 10N.286.49.C2]|uniref:LysR family transcriptional regulator n=1 Tax=unclassified Vibrio TaxID=2614977 RepID=UPI000C826C2E|nr:MULTISPECIES: LysR family transcriptional regulator [unclassified Vibrio]PMH42884.1 LysR family transcriptional regulator [Vibrio sp. 10N.286.49.C2]PMH53777.1 LysR family transcriptional regulator [Vibrio sp. 10N.286.49.B1]PMH77943.1 LysR family transcriptional regulator [Vibrio sp. 10N.286.48.B7]
MAKDLFSNLDLNLLRTFLILNQERNMRKASERLFVSQPAVSKALQRLRDHFDDELFVKTHHGLRATEKANILAESLSPILDELSNAVNHSSEFDPSALDGTIKIAMSPFFLSSTASKLFRSIREEAPNTQIQLLNWGKTTLQDIVNDDVQLGLNYSIAHAPKELVQTRLTTDTFKAYVRKGHPYDKDVIQMQDAGNFEVATLIAADWNSNLSNTEKVLKVKGIEPNVVFRSELPSAVIDVVKNSDILFPGSMYLNLDDHAGLRSINIQFGNSAINTDINSYYHYKNRNNATTQWLRKKLRLSLELE